MSQHTNPLLTGNNLDLLRLLFAATVCFVHAYELSGFDQLRFFTTVFSSTVAVKGFFVISGFLIVMSFERSATFSSYIKRRIRRIYPAYCTMVMLCASGLFIVSSKEIGAYFSLTWLKYLSANLIFLNFLQPTLPGVFDSNRLAAVNGALWTLKVEVMFYLVVPFLVYLFRKFGHLTVLTLLYCASVAYTGLLAEAAARTGSEMYTVLGRQLPGQLSYFLAGAFFYYFLPLFERHIGYFLAAAITALCADMFLPLPILEPFALATLTIFFGLFFHFGNFAKFGDFSYGIYILHFPVIQLLLHSGWFKEHPWYFFFAITFLTGAGAIAMWHLIEKRFLFRKNHYITAASTPDTVASEAGVAIEAGRR